MKNALKIFLLSMVLLVQVPAVIAQGNLDEALAAEFYRNGEFDKASVLYKKLLDRNPASALYYDSYLNCLLQLKDYATAEKEIKKLIKKNDALLYRVDLGYIYSLQGDEKKSKRQFDEIIDDMPADEEKIKQVASTFSRRQLTEYSIKALEKGRRLQRDDFAFIQDLAELYAAKGDYEKMLNEYVNVLEANPYEIEAVKDQLQDVVMQDIPYDIFKKMLLKKVQGQPDNIVYTDMLNWLFVQRRDFGAAFIQTKAMDKRLREGGRRLIDLAKVVTAYNDYELAERIYQTVIDQGQDAPYYIPAQRGILDIKYLKITQTANFTNADIDILINSYNDFLNKYGMVRQESGEVILRLAEVQAQYTNKPQIAIDLLKKYVSIAGTDKSINGRAKLALGDYHLLTGDSWESTLYYGQVEKMFKDNPLGHEAKFRNAKLSFYRGEFEWAKAQLDVLKSSTSELIANDAMQLALLIQDNIGLDTTEVPLRMYAEADFLIFKNMFTEAELKLDSINRLYPNHTLDDDILMARANIAFKKRDYPTALGLYEKVYTNYGQDILGDDALYKAAKINDINLQNTEKARELYEKLILTYLGSVYTVDARTRYRQLRGDDIKPQ